MDEFENKIRHFLTALTDVYKTEEDKEATALSPLDFAEEELTEDFTAMIYAMWGLYCNITEDEIDVIGFTHIMNRLAIQKLMVDKGVQLD